MAARTNTFSLRFVLEKEKLNGNNYADWIRNLRIVLRAEKKEEILDTPLWEELAENVPVLTLTNDHFQASTWSENHKSLHFLHTSLYNKVSKPHFTF